LAILSFAICCSIDIHCPPQIPYGLCLS
jgi:hypothetical protein